MTLDEFQQADLRVGRILAAEPVEGSEKLLKLSVDLGMPDEGARQILSGIAKHYGPDDLVGKNVVIIANLEPRKMMGLESRGMLLAAHGEDGAPILLGPGKDVPPGSKIL
ncbi:MAG TPA: methionine--tRNA ligase subunit beta [Candidatus Paceibacterota bacterium]|nr:methionine--tRNA ligase subunit beta [Candidatus Paceibacterota bacterium]